MNTVAKKYNLALIKKQPTAKDTYSFYFQYPKDLQFLPGQFMRLTLNLPQSDLRGTGRFFSLASSPTEREFLMITIRTSPQIYKKTLLDLQPGEKVQISLPYGAFVLKPDEPDPYIFLAGGIGITPFRSMIRYSLDCRLTRPITLFTSFSNQEDIVFRRELSQIKSTNSWFKLVETITQPLPSSLEWGGNVGRIDASLIRKNAPEYPGSIFYLAGPPAMVEAMISVVKSLGNEESRIRREKFTGY